MTSMVAKQAVYFVNLWPEPQSSAAGVRTREMAYFVQRLGYDLIAVAPGAPSSHSKAWQDTGAKTITCDPNSTESVRILETLHPELVMYDRFYTEEKYGWRARDLWPHALHVIDTSDLHCLRTARQKALLAGENVFDPHSGFFADDYLREMAALHRVDVCLVVSSIEAEWLKRQGYEAERVCYLPFSAKEDSTRRPEADRKGFCFLGNFRHAPNLDAVQWLVSELWPAVIKQMPLAELHLYGAYAPQSVTKLHGKNGIRSHGYVENHRAAIASHRLMLAPLRFGAGIKGKILEAWATGTPVLGTQLAFEDMGSGFAEFQDAAQFVDQIQRLQHSAYWNQNADRGLAQLSAKFDQDTLLRTFGEFLISSRSSLPTFRASLTGRLLRHHGSLATKYFSQWIEEKNRNRSGS